MKGEEYYEEERPLRGGMFTSWKRLLVDHLNDCYRQRRVFREALNDLRTEMLTETERMHAENKEKISEIKEILSDSITKRDSFQWKIMAVAITTLAGMLAYFVVTFGPLARHL